jgi:hypothetical protein
VVRGALRFLIKIFLVKKKKKKIITTLEMIFPYFLIILEFFECRIIFNLVFADSACIPMRVQCS